MAVSEEQLRSLKDRARRMRIDILKMLHGCGSGHTGGSLSATDIMTALYFYKMKYDPKKPDWKERDYFMQVKTRMALPKEQVDKLREVGGRLLRETPGFQRLLADLKAER